MKLKKGDTVMLIAGNDKGKKGKILSVLGGGAKITVEGVAITKKHTKARQQGKKGEIIEFARSFPASRAMIFCSKCGRGVRIGMRISGEIKTRICKRCGSEL